MEYLPIILFGWPGAVLSGVLLVSGIAFRKPGLSIVGAVCSVGFCAYVAMSPTPFRWLGVLVFAGNFLSAVAMWRGAVVLAVAAVVPFFVLIAYLATSVLNQ